MGRYEVGHSAAIEEQEERAQRAVGCMFQRRLLEFFGARQAGVEQAFLIGLRRQVLRNRPEDGDLFRRSIFAPVDFSARQVLKFPELALERRARLAGEFREIFVVGRRQVDEMARVFTQDAVQPAVATREKRLINRRFDAFEQVAVGAVQRRQRLKRRRAFAFEHRKPGAHGEQAQVRRLGSSAERCGCRDAGRLRSKEVRGRYARS